MIKICKNIAKFRKDHKMTQAQVAEYLGVSPQAVSKWEQELAMPDVYLIPKIAFLFSVSIDLLFGTSNHDSAKLLVSRYHTLRNEKNYMEAKEAVNSLLEMDNKDSQALLLLSQLEHLKALDHLGQARQAAQTLLDMDNEYAYDMRIRLMKLDAKLENYDFIEDYMAQFEANQSAENFNYLLIALGLNRQYDESLRWADDYLHTFDKEALNAVYPNIMEAALQVGDKKYINQAFDFIINNNSDQRQIFNAWWLMWLFSKKNKISEVKTCQDRLLELLPDQGYNEYALERVRSYILGESDKTLWSY